MVIKHWNCTVMRPHRVYATILSHWGGIDLGDCVDTYFQCFKISLGVWDYSPLMDIGKVLNLRGCI